MEKRPRKTIEAILPGQLKIKLGSPTGTAELQAGVDAANEPEVNRNKVITWSLMMRSTLELDGVAFKGDTLTARSYRDLFDSHQFMLLTELWFESFYKVSEEDEKKFRESKSVGVA